MPRFDAMTEPLSSTAEQPAPMSLMARIVGVFFSPRATYASVAAHPRALGALAARHGDRDRPSNVAFASTAVGQDALLDVQVRFMESWGMTISDEMYAGRWRRRVETMAVPERGNRSARLLPGGVRQPSPVSSLGVFSAIMGGSCHVQARVRRRRALGLHHGPFAALRHAAQLRARHALRRGQPRRLPAVSGRDVVSRPVSRID